MIRHLSPPSLAPVINTEEIAQNYAQASNLLLKERDINAAALAFKQHVIDYPAVPTQLMPITGSARFTYFKDRMKWPVKPSP